MISFCGFFGLLGPPSLLHGITLPCLSNKMMDDPRELFDVNNHHSLSGVMAGIIQFLISIVDGMSCINT